MKFLKRIGLFAVAVLLAVGAVFVPKTIKSASADNTSYGDITFTSSDIIYSATAYTSQFYSDFNSYVDNSITNNFASNSILNYSFKLSLIPGSNGVYSLRYGYRGYYNSTYGLIPNINNYLSDGYVMNDLVFYNTSLITSRDYSGAYSRCLYRFGDTGTYYSCIGFVVDWSSATAEVPSLVMTTIELGSSNSNNGFAKLSYYNFDGTLGLSFNDCNIICYTDTNGFKFIFYIPSYFDSSDIPQFFLTYRKYYTVNAFDFSNNGYYLQGLEAGTSQGYDKGYNEGYSEGNSVGYNNGYNEGFDDGVLDSNNYSFFGLITAVIDAPVRVLTSLFNFNFLGINLWVFITSILTLSLVVFVVRKFLGKG